MPDNQFDAIQNDATGGAGEGEPALSTGDIQNYSEGIMSGYSNFVTDVGDIPVTATSRANGVFTTEYDVFQYLATGGLVGWEEVSPGEWEARPIGWAYVLRTQPNENDPDQIFYEVWIDEDTNPA